MKCVIRIVGILNSRISYPSIQNARYYARWSHRRPVGEVQKETRRGPKASWILDAEKDVVREGRFSKTASLVDDSDPVSEKLRDSQDETDSLDQSTRFSHKEDAVNNGFKYEGESASQGMTREGAFKAVDRSLGSARPGKEVISSTERKGKYYTEALPGAKPLVHKEYTDKKIEVPRFSKGEKKTSISGKELKRIESAAKLGVPLFERLGKDDTKLSNFILNTKSLKARRKSGMILLEGKRLISDALEAGVIPNAIFFTKVKDIQSLSLPEEKSINLYKITYKEMATWSDVDTSPGIIAFAKIPNIGKARPSALPLTIICDNIRDPGNLGAVLRTSAAVGCEKVILTSGCVDLWNPKVIRAAAGAHFRVTIDTNVNWNNIQKDIKQNAGVFVADNSSYDIIISVDEEDSREEEKEDEHEADSSLASSDEGEDESNRKATEITHTESFSYSVPLIPYYTYDFSTLKSLALIIGGETEGISEDAYNFMHERHGVRLNIPLNNDIESLNTGTALGVIAFEIKKHFLTKKSHNDEEESSETIQEDFRTSIKNV